jgi:hypothetical protein
MDVSRQLIAWVHCRHFLKNLVAKNLVAKICLQKKIVREAYVSVGPLRRPYPGGLAEFWYFAWRPSVVGHVGYVGYRF